MCTGPEHDFKKGDKVIVTREHIRAYWGGEFTVTDPEDGEFIRITNAGGRTGQFFPSSLSKIPPVFKFTKGDKVYIKRPNVTKEESWGGLLTVTQDYKSGDRYVNVQPIFNGTTYGFVGGFYPETVFHVEDMPESLQEAPSPLKPVVKRPKETLKLVFNAPERIISYLEAHPGSKKRELKKNQSRNYRLGGFETDFAKLLTDKRIYIAADGQIRVSLFSDAVVNPLKDTVPAEQAKRIFKQGDRVKVVRKIASRTDGWDNSWEPDMDNALGESGTVIQAYSDGLGVRIDFDRPFEGDDLSYPYTGLALITHSQDTRVPVTVDIALGTRVQVNTKYPFAPLLHGMLGTVTERRQKGLYVFVNLDGYSNASLFLPDELDVVTVNQTDGII